MPQIFIDGSAGTTGLRIHDRLAKRGDIELMTLSEADRKNPEKRKEMLNSSDITFLCLPDDAAREAVSFAENENVRIIDTSTAHRTLDGWSYGFPELSEDFRSGIKNGKRVAVPGCHAGGFISLIYPLVKAGVISEDAMLSCFSLTGYSGGGKKMIADYESGETPREYDAPRQYATGQNHKHLKEMKKITGLSSSPIFSPVVCSFYSGMQVTVPLFADLMKTKLTPSQIADIYYECYGSSPVVSCGGYCGENTFINALEKEGRDSMKITVFGNDERIILSSVYDNLGKGASGAAVQCMNIMLGLDETTGLYL